MTRDKLMPTSAPDQLEGTQSLPLGISSEQYRQHILNLVRQYSGFFHASPHEVPTVYKRIAAVTGRGYTTVKNWLHFNIGVPDLDAMARMSVSFRIPPQEVFPPDLLEGSVAGHQDVQPAGSLSMMSNIIPLNTRGNDTARQALARYAPIGSNLVLLQQVGSDAAGTVEHGQLMLCNSSIENIPFAGTFVLSAPGMEDSLCTRFVRPLFDQGIAEISYLGSKVPKQVELKGTELQGGWRVRGHVIAVLKELQL